MSYFNVNKTMTRILITADVHCGVGNKLDDCLWALSSMRQYAAENDIGVVAVLGDLFHDRVNLNIKVISEVAAFLDDARYKYDQDWLIFPGNHDMFMRHTWDVNSLKPIKRLITLIDDYGLVKIYGRRFRIIPFIQHEEIYMKVIDHIENETEGSDILLTHIGISNAMHNSCFLMQHWGLVNFNNTKFSKVFAGHFHCGQQFGNIYIPGSPIPFRFDEGMVPHGFYVLDVETDNVEFVDIKWRDGVQAPPDYITVSEADINDLDPTNANVRVILDNTKSRDELDDLRHHLESNGAVKISWMKAKEQEVAVPKESAAMEPDTLFEKFIDHDKPDGLSRDLLISLNKKVIDEAFSVSTEVDE